MSGISSKAANLTSNKEQTFQEQRFENDFYKYDPLTAFAIDLINTTKK